MRGRAGVGALIAAGLLVAASPAVAFASTGADATATVPPVAIASTSTTTSLTATGPIGPPPPFPREKLRRPKPKQPIGPPPAFRPDDTLTLIAAGDIMCHSQQLSAAWTSRGYDFAPSFAPVASVVSGADFAIGNLETTLSGRGVSGYPTFRSPTRFADAVKGAGFDLLTTANNHALDGGAYGVRFTSAYLDRLGLAHTGTNNAPPVIRRHRWLTIAMLSYTYDTNGIRSPFSGAVNRIDRAAMRGAIAAVRGKADLVVVYVHVGNEYSSYPEASTRSLGHMLVDSGADLVLGSHPHVVRPVERYRGRYIVYSMGNFISGQSQPMTDLGIMVRAVAKRHAGVTSVTSLKVLPTYRDFSPGAGRSTYRTLAIDKALASPDRLVSGADRADMRALRSYCAVMFRGYL